jgi:hypothetical protein
MTNNNEQPSGSGIESMSNMGEKQQNLGVVYNVNSDEIFRQKEAEKLLSSPTLFKKLQMMERAVQQNSYHRQHLDYRGLPDIPPLQLVQEEMKSEAKGFGGFGKSFGGKEKPSTAGQVRDDSFVSFYYDVIYL